MKKLTISIILALPALCWAQQAGPTDATPSGTVSTSVNFPIERLQTPTTSDLYCAGFLGKSISRDKFVAGGLESPHSTRFVTPSAGSVDVVMDPVGSLSMASGVNTVGRAVVVPMTSGCAAACGGGQSLRRQIVGVGGMGRFGHAEPPGGTNRPQRRDAGSASSACHPLSVRARDRPTRAADPGPRSTPPSVGEPVARPAVCTAERR